MRTGTRTRRWRRVAVVVAAVVSFGGVPPSAAVAQTPEERARAEREKAAKRVQEAMEINKKRQEQQAAEMRKKAEAEQAAQAAKDAEAKKTEADKAEAVKSSSAQSGSGGDSEDDVLAGIAGFPASYVEEIRDAYRMYRQGLADAELAHYNACVKDAIERHQPAERTSNGFRSAKNQLVPAPNACNRQASNPQERAAAAAVERNTDELGEIIQGLREVVDSTQAGNAEFLLRRYNTSFKLGSPASRHYHDCVRQAIAAHRGTATKMPTAALQTCRKEAMGK